MTYGQTNHICRLDLTRGPPVYNLWSWTWRLGFHCKISVLVLSSLSDTLLTKYLLTTLCSCISWLSVLCILHSLRHPFPKWYLLLWILFLGFNRLFTGELCGSHQSKHGMPWRWGWRRWGVWVFCLKIYYGRKMSPEERDFHFPFLPSLLFSSFCSMVTLVWSLS